jgi:hypothetical protein
LKPPDRENHFGPFAFARVLALAVIAFPLVMRLAHDGATKLPYGYFELLRWVVCPALAVTSYRALKARSASVAWTYGIVAAIFNPIFPARLGGGVWIYVDFAALTLIVASFFFAFGRDQKKP